MNVSTIELHMFLLLQCELFSVILHNINHICQIHINNLPKHIVQAFQIHRGKIPFGLNNIIFLSYITNFDRLEPYYQGE